jgi:NitT/TauT family transport system substrate-binding protein
MRRRRVAVPAARCVKRLLSGAIGLAILVSLGVATPLLGSASHTLAQTEPPLPDVLRLITYTPPLVYSVAQERGFFDREGLRVEHTQTGSSQELMTGVIDGTFDLAFSNPDN